MIIARRKRKENIAEYLLYMWQVEDLIRANNFDMDSIRRTVVDRYDQPDDIKEEIAKWYEELIEMMRSEGVMEKGHIQLNKNVIIALFHHPFGTHSSRLVFPHTIWRFLPLYRPVGRNDLQPCGGSNPYRSYWHVSGLPPATCTTDIRLYFLFFFVLQ